ncbi:hypothetical protein D9M72_416520 [compost metagenome]
MTAAAADDHRQLAFIVQLLGHARANDGLTVANEGGGETREEGGVGGLFVRAFLGVIGVVEPYADDLPGTLDGGQVADGGRVQLAGLAQAAVGVPECLRTGLEQVVQCAGKTFLVFSQAIQPAGHLDSQTLVGRLQKLSETHGEIPLLFLLVGEVRYGTVPFEQNLISKAESVKREIKNHEE